MTSVSPRWRGHRMTREDMPPDRRTGQAPRARRVGRRPRRARGIQCCRAHPRRAPQDPAASAASNRGEDPALGPSTPTSPPLGAVLVDWLLCSAVVVGFIGVDTAGGGSGGIRAPRLFALLNIVLVSTTGSTVGHRLFGMQVWQVRQGSFPSRSSCAPCCSPLRPRGAHLRRRAGLPRRVAGTRIVRAGSACSHRWTPPLTESGRTL